MNLGHLFESPEVLALDPIAVGDRVFVGKFKNRKAEVTGFATDDHNQPVLKTTKGDTKLFKPRLDKLDEAAPITTDWQAREHTYDNPLGSAPLHPDHVPILTTAQRRLIAQAKTSRKFARSLPEIEVPLSEIIPSQYWVHRDVVDQMAGVAPQTLAQAREPVIFFRRGGRVWMVDGHHRLVHAVRSGQPTLRGHLLDFDAAATGN